MVTKASFICRAYDCYKNDIENETCMDDNVFIEGGGECNDFHPTRTNEQVEALMVKYDKL